MPYTQPSGIIIIKRDGTQTRVMLQPQAESYLENLVDANRQANVKQSLNQTFDGSGKATGSYTFATQPVWHASSGNGEKSVSIFFYMNGSIVMIIAMGEHVPAKNQAKYKLSDYGQTSGDFKENNTITI